MSTTELVICFIISMLTLSILRSICTHTVCVLLLQRYNIEVHTPPYWILCSYSTSILYVLTWVKLNRKCCLEVEAVPQTMRTFSHRRVMRLLSAKIKQALWVNLCRIQPINTSSRICFEFNLCLFSLSFLHFRGKVGGSVFQAKVYESK